MFYPFNPLKGSVICSISSSTPTVGSLSGKEEMLMLNYQSFHLEEGCLKATVLNYQKHDYSYRVILTQRFSGSKLGNNDAKILIAVKLIQL